MKGKIRCGIAAATAAVLALGAAACGEPVTGEVEAPVFDEPQVTYSANIKNGTEISEELFGVFLEDINYASYALDDNLVANASFAYGTETSCWTADGATLTVSSGGGISGTNPSFGRVTAQAGGSIANTGYAMYPMAAVSGTEYRFSAFVRASGYSGGMSVSLVKGGEELASAKITVAQSADWVRYHANLTPSSTETEGVALKISFDAAGELDVDNVALETSDSTAGIKNSLFRAIEELSPAFVRFPGGCVIEGKNFASAYDWKNSVGADASGKVPEFSYPDVGADGTKQTVTTRGEWAVRKPNTDIWQVGDIVYQMDYAIGFYEYFVLCDLLGASAVPVVNCGLSCMIQSDGSGTGLPLPGRNGNGVQDYLQDALDLVAFAKGSVSSADENERYWAQVRADMGHPEPFEMHYLGIGNEQWGPEYYGIYEQFLEAFKAESAKNPIYGEVELIVGNGTHIRNCEGYAGDGDALAAMKTYSGSGKIKSLSEYGTVDHHYYLNCVDFLMHTDFYDTYSRDEANKYHVFVGEYSANSAASLSNGMFGYQQNSWIAALSEAAYMTGLERNGDVVRLAAYAPMFGAADPAFNQWAVDLMYYTNTALVRTANYYVQQAFMKNAATETFAVEETFADDYEPTCLIRAQEGNSRVYVGKLYKVISRDGRTGDVIVKIVNVSGEDIGVNVKLSGVSVHGASEVTLVRGAGTGTANTLGSEPVKPETFTLAAEKKFGYTAPAYSLTVIRLHT